MHVFITLHLFTWPFRHISVDLSNTQGCVILTVINTDSLIGLLLCVQLIVFVSNTVNYLANDKL
jgi:hypothetical protein